MTPRARRTFAAAGALVAVLAALGALALPDEAPGNVEAKKMVSAPPVPAPRTLRPIEAYAAIVERPLFSPTRRPAPPPAPKVVTAPAAPPAPAPPPPSLPAVTLLAVAIAPDRREAVLRLPTGSTATLAEGEELEGWRLAQVQPDRVVFRRDDQQKDVTFPVPQAARPRPKLLRPRAPPPHR